MKLNPTVRQSQAHLRDLFDQTCSLVEENFYNPTLIEKYWANIKIRFEPKAKKAESLEELSGVINDMLAQLNTSHTRFYTYLDCEYYELLELFRKGPLKKSINEMFSRGIPSYVSIGIFTKNLRGKTFIKGILEGSPGDKAGLKIGDQIIAVDGEPYYPIKSFIDKLKKKVEVEIRFLPKQGGRRFVQITPVEVKPSRNLIEATRNSIKIIKRGHQKVGYVHLWTGSEDAFYKVVMKQLISGKLREVDSLVLDLRGGVGGANPNFLNVFNQKVPKLIQIDKRGNLSVVDDQWRKPLVLLVNEDTRSGKEMLAYGVKRYGLGTLVGTKTAGAALAGRPFILIQDAFLYLAVEDVLIDDERLEGKGVTPDILVPFPLSYAHGDDPQLERALEYLSK